MAPQIERAAGLRPQHRFAKVNVDENPALASAYGVRAIPTLAILRDGKLLGTAPGLVRSDELVAALDRRPPRRRAPLRLQERQAERDPVR